MAKKQSKLFDYINAISLTKNEDFLEDPDFPKHYVPFVVNMAFSFYPDTILAANIVNERSWLSPQLQARILLNTMRARKRYSPWLKHSISDDVMVVSEYYGCSVRHAKTLTELHTPEQLVIMRQRLHKGGSLSNRGYHDDADTGSP